MNLSLRWSAHGDHLRVHVPDADVPRPALVAAAHDLLGRAHAVLVPAEGGVELRLAPLEGGPPEGLLDALAERLAHHLVHLRVEESTARLREYVFARAFFAAPDRSSIDRLLAELDVEDEELAAWSHEE